MSRPMVEQLSSTDAATLARAMGLADDELAVIEAQLGRVPTRSELAVFAGMWSEHCSYKSTRHLLATLPRRSPRVLAGPGAHAGVVDVGEGWAVAFKVESHNHPSAVEPYQGAATGVGGILRDIIAEGARPCAVMDSLCFGMPAEPQNRRLQRGVVAGIAGYGNAFGVPNVGGRTAFDARYQGNPLVNALAAGLIRPDALRTAAAAGEGNAVIYVGARTGRDGILGAAFASTELGADTVEDRPHVQVGDPFSGKKLMEACLGFTPQAGLVACQDMGACGITCAITEMSAAGGCGMEIELERVPLREAGMPAAEILLSESQERFMFVVRAADEQAALAYFRGFGVQAEIVGRVTAGGRVRVCHHGELVVDLPAELVVGGTPSRPWPTAELPPAPDYPPFAAPADCGAVLLELLGAPGITDLTPLWSHYDQTVGNRTVRGPAQASAAVLRLPGSTRGFALTLTGNGEWCAADPYLGTQAVLAEVARNLACAGAELVAITDGLNLGSPTDPRESQRLTRVIAGLKEGLERLGVPVTGGNVSLYNESPLGAIPPTPMIGGLGLVADVTRVPAAGLGAGQRLALLGWAPGEPSTSCYGRLRTGLPGAGRPAVDLERVARLCRVLVDAAGAGLLTAAKDAGRGGLAVALAKLCLRGGTGATVALPATARLDWSLFGEPAAAAWVSLAPSAADALAERAARQQVPCAFVGETAGTTLSIDGALRLPVAALAEAFVAGGERWS